MQKNVGPDRGICSGLSEPSRTDGSVARDVCAIVPTYNRSGYLRECLVSLTAQTVRPGRIIVIDDGSTDDTAEVVRSFGDGLVYVRQDNAGKSAALNRALGQVTEEFVWIFDDDDIADPKALDHLRTPLLLNPAAGFSYGDYAKFWDAAEAASPHQQPQNDFAWLPLKVGLLFRCFINQPGLLVRKSLYDAVGPFDTDFVRSQDWQMMNRLARHADGVKVNHTVFLQRQHDGVRGTATVNIEGARRRELWQRFDRRIIGPIRDSYALSEYLGFDRALELSGRDQFSALLVRATIAMRRGMWDEAIADLTAASKFADDLGVTDLTEYETTVIRQGMGNGSRALDGFPQSRLKPALDRFTSKALRGQLRQALAFYFPSEMRLAQQASDRGRLRSVIGAYRETIGILGLPRHLAQKGVDRLRKKSNIVSRPGAS